MALIHLHSKKEFFVDIPQFETQQEFALEVALSQPGGEFQYLGSRESW